MAHEHEIRGIAGWPMVFLLAAVVLAASAGLVLAAREAMVEGILLSSLVIAIACACFAGLTVVNPNQAKVVTLFGVYKGSLKAPGLWWVNPLTTRRRLSLRVRNFESGKLKVNDHDGNPIEIAAVIVWRIVETFEAVFNVDDYESFVQIQSESALRAMATSYPYDQHEEGQLSLRSHAAEISAHLAKELSERLADAGVQVLDARISHLAYAPEIAQAMLQRQQANAIIAARTRIVAGAVGMVEMALAELQKNGVVHLDEERKAQMVSNLLVVLCGERATQPIVNAGTLY